MYWLLLGAFGDWSSFSIISACPLVRSKWCPVWSASVIVPDAGAQMSNPPLPEGTKSIPWSMPAKLAPLLTKAEYFPLPPHPDDVLLAAAPLISAVSSEVSKLLSNKPPPDPTASLISRQGLAVSLLGVPVWSSGLAAAKAFQLVLGFWKSASL